MGEMRTGRGIPELVIQTKQNCQEAGKADDT